MSAQVFVVDPDPFTQQLLTQNLNSAGHAVACCPDAESAMVLLDEQLPDLLVLEWELDGQSGETLVRRLRARARTRELPIIMLTSRAAEHDKIMALESGADDYLTKPFSPRELLARMGAVLRRRVPACGSTPRPSG